MPKHNIPTDNEDELKEEKPRPQKRRKEVIEKEYLRAGWKKKLEKKCNLEKYAQAIGVRLSYPKNRKKRLPKTNCWKKYLTVQFARDGLYIKTGLQELIIKCMSI